MIGIPNPLKLLDPILGSRGPVTIADQMKTRLLTLSTTNPAPPNITLPARIPFAGFDFKPKPASPQPWTASTPPPPPPPDRPTVLPPPFTPDTTVPEPYKFNPTGPMFDPMANPGTPVYTDSAGDPNWADLAKSIGCDAVTARWGVAAGQLCRAAATLIPGNPKTTANPAPLAGECPKGYHRGANGGCEIDGLGTYLPGDVGRPDYVWTPIYGRYGAGTTPVLVQRNVRACPSGYVLGNDGVCYDHLARTHRAHNPGTKPLLTGGDMNALRRAHQLQKTIGKINRRFGKKVAKQCAPKRKGR